MPHAGQPKLSAGTQTGAGEALDPLEESGERVTVGGVGGRVANDDDVSLDDTNATQRYRAVTLLGEGGMGEVRLCDDLRIRRQVAMKVLHPSCANAPAERARFFREVLAQGQLDHPAIVPVHDVG